MARDLDPTELPPERPPEPPADTRASITDAELRFSAARVEVPLAPLAARLGGEQRPRLARPAVSAPVALGDLELKPVRDLALRELLSHAESGRATVRLPLPARSFRVGPFSVELPEGTMAVIELHVQGAAILREETHGTLEPPIALPLGISFRGLYLDEDGAIIADIANFPDINLSKLIDRVPYIPGTLDELLGIVFDGERPATSAPTNGATTNGATSETTNGAANGVTKGATHDVTKGAGLDLSGLRVEARDVVPRAEVFSLGNAGQVRVGPETRLDVDFAKDELTIRGRVEVLQATLEGAGFLVRDFTGRGTFTWTLRGLSGERSMRVEARCFGARAEGAQVSLKDGTRVELGPADVESAELSLLRADGQLRFRVDLGSARGSLEHALVLPRVGDEVVPVELGGAEVRGSASVSERHLEVSLDVSGLSVESPGVKLGLGLAELDVTDVRARADGHLKAGTDYGFAFSGELEAGAELAGGAIALGPLEARLAERSRARVVLKEIAAGPEGLDVLVGSGEARLALASGSLPLGPTLGPTLDPKAKLSFSRGAKGTLTLAAIERLPGQRWPVLRGGLHVEAESDPVMIADLARLPGGRAIVDTALSLDEKGRLVLEGLDMRLRSEDG